MPRSGAAGPHGGSMCNFLRPLRTVFHGDCAIWMPPTPGGRTASSPRPRQHLSSCLLCSDPQMCLPFVPWVNASLFLWALISFPPWSQFLMKDFPDTSSVVVSSPSPRPVYPLPLADQDLGKSASLKILFVFGAYDTLSGRVSPA